VRVLITGITGLLGSHLAAQLVADAGVEVFGLKRWRTPITSVREISESVRILEGDVTDPSSVIRTIEEAQPDRIFHYAAQSYSQESLAAPHLTFETNVLGTLNVLEASRRLRPGAQVLVAGSSASYGLIDAEKVPVSEEYRLRPTTPYGVSKAAQEMLALQYFDSYGLPVYVARFFLQVGPRQGERTSIQTFARQIAEIERSEREPIVYAGNLWPVRDFTDARDAARAAWLVLERGHPGEVYNVCRGIGIRMGDILEQLRNLTHIPFTVHEQGSRVRAVDEPVIVGDPSKLRAATGWRPEIAFEQTLHDVLDYWREVH
jgi:GDP-4-dehydro-6-deoxy-D-mannose reductase